MHFARAKCGVRTLPQSHHAPRISDTRIEPDTCWVYVPPLIRIPGRRRLVIIGDRVQHTAFLCYGVTGYFLRHVLCLSRREAYPEYGEDGLLRQKRGGYIHQRLTVCVQCVPALATIVASGPWNLASVAFCREMRPLFVAFTMV